MRLRHLLLLVSVCSFLQFVSCSGSSAGANLRTAPCGAGGSTFCVSSCSLGCTSVGCSVTEIAQNQAITLNFSGPVDPGSVNAATFSIKTAAGESPAGSLVVEGGVISFVPEVRIIGGNTFFGFKANQTYIMTLPGGAGEQLSVRSVSGDRLASTISCTLNVTRGIVDPDGQPPRAKLVQPTTAADVPNDITVLLEFSEFIDTAPFQSSSAGDKTPVEFRIIKSRPRVGGQPGEVECDPNFPPIDLEGSTRAQINAATGTTTVSFRPAIRLPGEVCVEVTITPRVTDLSGRPSAGQSFVFVTKPTGSELQQILEDFKTLRQRDASNSSGSWGPGVLTPGLIGGEGELGAFNVADGREVAPGVFEWSTDSQRIRGRTTRSGEDVTVTDGVFHFSSFELDADRTMRIVGSRPARIYVRGRALISGKISTNGTDAGQHQATLIAGQGGSTGGAGGGKGGQGADKGSGTGHTEAFDGRPGQDVQLLDGHAYKGTRAPGTGGRGSTQIPISGLDANVLHQGGVNNALCPQVAAGGGGGGSRGKGSNGQAQRSNRQTPATQPLWFGKDGDGGKAFDPFPVPAGDDHMEHFLIGGSGGGGGGCHPLFEDRSPTKVEWWSGAGGTGGGGAVGFRVGGDLTTSASAQLTSNGGTGFTYASLSQVLGTPAPGGAGSGGSFVFQVGGDASMGGTVNVLGGIGGKIQEPTFGDVFTFGGNGAPGMILLETPAGASIGQLGTTLPPADSSNVGQLEDRDDLVGDQSLFYATGAIFAPEFRRYVIRAIVRGQQVIFTDDPQYEDPAWGPSLGLAIEGQAIRLYVQGAKVDAASGEPEAGSIKPWRRYVRETAGEDSIATDQVTGLRFQVVFDKAVEANVSIVSVAVVYKT